MKRLLFIGDVVGRAGCEFLADKLSGIKRENNIDITIVNGENSAQGNGITRGSADAIIRAGADIITTGNHAFRRKESMELFDEDYIVGIHGYCECLRCSECGKPLFKVFNYCPWCGKEIVK